MPSLTSAYLMVLLAIAIGGALILGALYLLNTKKISLDQVAKNPSLKGAAMKVEIEKLIRVSANAPALGLFLVGLALVVAGLYYANEEGKRKGDEAKAQLAAALAEVEQLRAQIAAQRVKLNVTGSISKSDRRSPRDIEVQMSWPPFRPDDNGKLNGLSVRRDIDGRLPILSFLHPQYGATSLDLNVEAKVQGNDIVIPAGQVVLMKIPGNGGVQ